MKNEVRHEPVPEMLGRKDAEHGQWQIDDCAPVRGNPYTNIIDRKMVVPVSQEELDRVIRAHEMIHARVSPADDYPRWVERGIASDTALRMVEEVRVNYLAKKAGFNIEILKDGSELASGQKLAERGDWAGTVYTAVGYSLGDAGKDFLTGVRRVNREWGTLLRDIMKKVEKEIDKAYKTGRLGSTTRDPDSGLAPLGFGFTERIAEMVDRFANPPKVEEDEDGEQGEQSEGNSENGGEETKDADAGNPTKKAPIKKEDVKKATPARSNTRGVAQWSNLKVRKLPLNRHAPGGLGRKRRASDMGRNPRRIGNALVDPQKRIFDASKKGNGGVVVIDGSGSMHFTTEDIVRIVEASHGATVAVYSASGRIDNEDNLFILAQDGRMVTEIPKLNGGNGVDAPALRWGIKQKKNSRTPVVFVTDGLVHGVGQGYDDLLAMDCINEVMRHNVVVRPNVQQAVKALEELKIGRKPVKWFPSCWQGTWQRTTGKKLPSAFLKRI